MPRSISPVWPDGVTYASDFHRKFELIETTWKLSLDESSNTASTVPAVPQSSVMWSVFLLAGSAAAGPAATASNVIENTTARAIRGMRNLLRSSTTAEHKREEARSRG